MPGETRRSVLAQPDWLRSVPRHLRLPEGARVVFVGCGTSFHAAQTGGWAVQALEAVLAPPDADLMVCVSHEGETPLTLEAARAFPGPKWLVTGAAVLAARRARRRGRRLHAGDREVVVPHGELHLRGRGDRGAARRGHRVASGRRSRRRLRLAEPAPGAVEDPRRRRRPRLADGAGGGAEAARGRLGRRRRPTTPSSCSTATSPRSTRACAPTSSRVRAARPSVRTVLWRRSRCSAARRRSSRRRHPVVDIVRFQLLTLAIAEARGIDPDPIHRDDERWARARETYE